MRVKEAMLKPQTIALVLGFLAGNLVGLLIWHDFFPQRHPTSETIPEQDDLPPKIYGCNAMLQGGGNTAGIYSSGTTGICTVTLTFATTAPVGWACSTTDEQVQIASSATTATLSGTTIRGDVLKFYCAAY